MNPDPRPPTSLPSQDEPCPPLTLTLCAGGLQSRSETRRRVGGRGPGCGAARWREECLSFLPETSEGESGSRASGPGRHFPAAGSGGGGLQKTLGLCSSQALTCFPPLCVCLPPGGHPDRWTTRAQSQGSFYVAARDRPAAGTVVQPILQVRELRRVVQPRGRAPVLGLSLRLLWGQGRAGRGPNASQVPPIPREDLDPSGPPPPCPAAPSELDRLRKLWVYLERGRHPGPGHGLSLPVPRVCKTSRGAGRLAHFLREALTFRRRGSAWPRGCCVWEATRPGGSRAGHLAPLQPRPGCAMASRLQLPTGPRRRGPPGRAPVAPWELLSSHGDPAPGTGRLPPASRAETVGPGD